MSDKTKTMRRRATQNRMSVALIFIVFALACVTLGCKKSERDIAEAKAIERHKQEAAHGYAPSPAQLKRMPNHTPSPAAERLQSETTFLAELKENGLLPGVSKDLKGYFGIWEKTTATPEGGATQEVHFLTSLPANKSRKNYHYIVSRAASNSTWQINKAWLTDSSGKVIQEYPVQ